MCALMDIVRRIIGQGEVQEPSEAPETPEAPTVPSWVTQTKEEVADAELVAASIHYAWMVAIEEGRMTKEEIAIGGDYTHHEYWYRKHTEAAWFTAPEYTERRLSK